MRSRGGYQWSEIKPCQDSRATLKNCYGKRLIRRDLLKRTAEIPARSSDSIRGSEGRVRGLSETRLSRNPAGLRRRWFSGCDFHILESTQSRWTQGYTPWYHTPVG